VPKLKTKRSAAKRFRISASGKILRGHSCKSHILTKKSRKRKRNLRKTSLVAPADVARVREMLNV